VFGGLSADVAGGEVTLEGFGSGTFTYWRCGWTSACTSNCEENTKYEQITSHTKMQSMWWLRQLVSGLCWNSNSTTGQSMWDLWCTKWHWNMFSLRTSGSLHHYHSTTTPYSHFIHLPQTLYNLAVHSIVRWSTSKIKYYYTMANFITLKSRSIINFAN
jgi:hypothetical protein